MSDLLTHAEYLAIAKDMEFPRTAFIDGKYRAGTGAVFATINPATGEELAQISGCGGEDLDFAVGKAREAFDQGHWSKMHPSDRKDVLIKLCKLITRNRRELAVMESLESGKPILDCETIDLPETIHCIKWHAEAIDKIYDQTSPTGDDAISMIVREPIGVVGAMELPADDVGVENRPCAGGRVQRDRQTGRTNLNDGVAGCRTCRRSRRAARCVSGLARRWPKRR